jgi:hypothetical protein
MENLEFRMYGLVAYQLSGTIHAGIQYGHALQEYNNIIMQWSTESNISTDKQNIIKNFKNWAINHKTFIILNGGTTNTKIMPDGKYFGTLNNHKVFLDKIGVFNTDFYEPDLGEQLTAITFLLDERIFNREKYPDFKDWLLVNYKEHINNDILNLSSQQIINNFKESKSNKDLNVYKKWLNCIGGENNNKLREFIRYLKLA